MRAYVAGNCFSIGSTTELFQTLQANTDHDLEPILSPWFPSLYWGFEVAF